MYVCVILIFLILI